MRLALRGVGGNYGMTGKRLVFHTNGNPADVLRLEEFAPREPGGGEVLVRMEAAPLNPADLNTVEGTYGVKLDLPATPGIEGGGVVEISRADGFSPGDRVMFLARAATWATHTTVTANALIKLPAEIDPLQAAMLKVNPATAYCLLNHFEKLKPGDWVVLNLGNSAVGRCVIQLARIARVRTISFVRRLDTAEELQRLGAGHVLMDDEDGLAAAKEAMNGANAVLAFNGVGGESALRLMKLLRKSGTHVTYGAMGRKPVSLPNGLLIFRDIRLRGLWVTRWLESIGPHEVREIYNRLAQAVLDGTLVQPVDRSFALGDFKNALARLNARERTGKVLFEM